jgi:hypothetical protein
LRHKGETTEFSVRTVGEDNPSITPKSSVTPDREEWAWMIDEDPAFYLSEAPGA